MKHFFIKIINLLIIICHKSYMNIYCAVLHLCVTETVWKVFSEPHMVTVSTNTMLNCLDKVQLIWYDKLD